MGAQSSESQILSTYNASTAGLLWRLQSVYSIVNQYTTIVHLLL